MIRLTEDFIRELVRSNPGRTAEDLCQILSANGGPMLEKSDLNSYLYTYRDVVEWKPGNGYHRLWFLKASWNDSLGVYPWQKEALEWWKRNSERGVVEAVTGAGKTRLALAAAAEQLLRKQFVVVVVHTKELLIQWQGEFEKLLRDRLEMNFTIGWLGAGRNDVDRNPDVLLTSVQTAYRHPDFQQLPPGLVIADEVHHYGAPQWSRALNPTLVRRVGLTATYEREDSGIAEYLDPYFGGNVFSVDYERALSEDIIAPFKIAFIGVSFAPGEQLIYEEHSERASRLRRRLIEHYEVTEGPFGEFMREVHHFAEGGFGEATGVARGYLDAFSKRRHALASASQKYVRLSELAPAIGAADKAILFTQTQEAAAKSIAQLNAVGIEGSVLTSEMDMSERKEVFAGFETGKHELVAAPRLLDEGIDVPSADLAIVLATSRSRRQMIQRMGRVIRKKDDGRIARLAVLYVEGTIEDPNVNAHEDFFYLVEDVAEDVRVFPVGSAARAIVEYLNDWHR